MQSGRAGEGGGGDKGGGGGAGGGLLLLGKSTFSRIQWRLQNSEKGFGTFTGYIHSNSCEKSAIYEFVFFRTMALRFALLHT